MALKIYDTNECDTHSQLEKEKNQNQLRFLCHFCTLNTAIPFGSHANKNVALFSWSSFDFEFNFRLLERIKLVR